MLARMSELLIDISFTKKYTSKCVTSYATIIIDIFEITVLGENHINKPENPAVCTL